MNDIFIMIRRKYVIYLHALFEKVSFPLIYHFKISDKSSDLEFMFFITLWIYDLKMNFCFLRKWPWLVY